MPSETAPADLALVDGNNQNGTAGQPLTNPIVVKVTDRRGQPVPRQKVAFALVTEAPGAEVIPDTAETGSNGTAEARWTLGSVSGTQRVVAHAVGFHGLEVSFDAVVGSGGAARTRVDFKVQPSNTKERRTVSPPVEVEVLDRDGNRVTSREIEVKLDLIGERDGRLRGHTRQWTESGVATFSDLKIEREGNYRLRASADGLPSVDSDPFEVQH